MKKSFNLKLFATALSFLFLNLSGIAQSKVDSLILITESAVPDSMKIKAYLKLFNTDLFFDDIERVKTYSRSADQLSKKINFAKGEVEANNNLGYIFRTQSKVDSALFHYKYALDRSQSIGYYKGTTDAFIGIGNVYNQQSKWQEAIQTFDRVILEARKQGDSIQIASASNNIGNTYLNQSMFEAALKAYQRSVQLGDPTIRETAMINIAVVHNQLGNTALARNYFVESIDEAQKLGKKSHVAFIKRNLGILEKQEGRYEKAIDYYEEALVYYESVSDDFSRSEITQNLGNVYFEKGEYSKSIDYYKRSIELQEQIGYGSGACYNYLYLAIAMERMGNLNSALNYLDQVEVCSDTLDFLPTRVDATKLESQIFEKQGKYRRSLEAFQNFKNLSDSLRAISSEEKIAELEKRFQTEGKEREIELLNSEKEVANLRILKQRNFLLLLGALALVLITIATFAFLQYRNKLSANRHLREMDELKNRFYTNISHEFRTPLTLILNPLSQILEKSDQQSVQKNALIAERNANRLLELTNQMLDLSKLEAGKIELAVGAHNLSNFLSIIVDSFNSFAETKDIQFHVLFSDLERVAFFDIDKLHKILINLLGNAFKFTPPNGEIFFKAEVNNGKLVVEIEDSGPGLDEEDVNRIFDVFYQNDAVSQNSGTGIGLALTKELVELHKGGISAMNRKSKGSIFKFWIPIEKQNYEGEAFVDAFVEPMATNFLQEESLPVVPFVSHTETAPLLLIVEDNADLRSFLVDLFSNNFEVIAANNGIEGLKLAIDQIPDLIISDWMMPELSGEKLCAQLKSDQLTAHIPIILLTARADHSSKIEGLSIGADDYLAKPFDNEELLLRAQNLMRQRQLFKEKYADLILIEPTQVKVSDPDKLFIEKAINIVEDNIDDSEFTVEVFSKKAGVSRMQLHRKLKALVDQSASEFIRNIRLKRAANLLLSNHLHVSEVAYQCGFNNLSYFGQCFKEEYGVPPSQYLKSLKEKV